MARTSKDDKVKEDVKKMLDYLWHDEMTSCWEMLGDDGIDIDDPDEFYRFVDKASKKSDQHVFYVMYRLAKALGFDWNTNIDL